jgi:hypothetical protein
MQPVRTLGLLLCACAALAAQGGRADEANPADAVIQRYIEASGGLARLSAIHSRVLESTMKAGWIKLDARTTAQWPDRVLVESRLPIVGTRISNGYDGATAWVTEAGGSARRLQGRELQEFVLGQRLDRMTRLFELYPQRRLLPPKAGGGAGPPQVEMTTQFGTRETWTFDPASGLLQAAEGMRDGGPKKGLIRIVTRFDDYRTADGLTLPFHAALQSGDSSMTLTVNAVHDNVPVDPAAFTPPKELGAPAPGS